MGKNIKNNCAVVVSSFDGFSDLWKPFFTLFFKYWPDCPFSVYLIGNYKKYESSKVQTILVGKDHGWATNMKRALKKIKTPYIIYLQDDYFFQDYINTGYIFNLINYLQKNSRVGCIRLYPSPGPDRNFLNELGLGRIGKRAKYRVSLQASLWRRDIFDKLIVEGENGWEMEIKGSERSRSIDKLFLSVKKPVIYYHKDTALVKGKWTYDVVKFCKKQGIKLDLKKRPIAYGRKFGPIIDRIRKSSLAEKIHNIPIIGDILSFLYWSRRKKKSKKN